MDEELLEAAARAGDSDLWYVGGGLAHIIGASGICANEIGTVFSTTRGDGIHMKAMVALWHQGKGKALAIQTGDLRAFLDEIKETNEGYVVIGVKPLGEVDPLLLREVTGEQDDEEAS
jgi:hypothetical protein